MYSGGGAVCEVVIADVVVDIVVCRVGVILRFRWECAVDGSRPVSLRFLDALGSKQFSKVMIAVHILFST